MREIMVTYEPDNSLKKGYLAIFKEIFEEIKQNRWLTLQLFKRDFFAMYKQSFIGIFWIFIMPIINVGVFVMLNRSGIFNFGVINVPYPLYAILGMAFWQLFSTGVLMCGSSLTGAGDMITRINFSKKSLVIAPIGRSLVSFLVQFILVGILFIIYKIIPSKGMLLIPIVIIPIIFLTLGIGFIIALLNAIVRDAGNLLSISMMLLMYLTPVLYAKPQLGILTQITKYNPMYYMISTGRDLILNNTISEPKGFLFSVVISFILFITSLVAFHLTETRITERI